MERASGGHTTLTWLGELLHQQSHDSGLARSIGYDELAQPVNGQARTRTVTLPSGRQQRQALNGVEQVVTP